METLAPTPNLAPPLRADADEVAVLGSCIISPSLVATLPLKPGDFFRSDTRATFEAMHAIVTRGDLPIWTALVAEIAARGDTVRPSILLDWANACPTPVHALHYARNVARAAQRRRLLSASSTVATIAVDPALSADDATRLAGQLVDGVRPAGTFGAEIADGTEAAASFVERKEELRAGKSPALATGYYDLDRYLSGGVRPGQLCIIGGRPGMGKSSILRDIARTLAMQATGRVLFASNEMGIGDLVDRDIAVLSNVSLAAVVAGTWNAGEQERIDQAEFVISLTPLTTIADGGMTTDALRARAAQLHAQEPLAAIVVDYLQRMADPGRSDLERVSRIARALKSLAMELGVPVLAGSQLSRTTERESQDTRPTLIDLRNSGEIEQEADIVLLLYRAGYYYPTEQQWRKESRAKNEPYPGNEAEIVIAKQRQGPSGVTVRVLWVPLLATFRNLATRIDGDSR